MKCACGCETETNGGCFWIKGHIWKNKSRSEKTKQKMSESRRNKPEDVWEKIDIKNEDECWNWMGGLRRGYGRFMIEQKIYQSHRIVFKLIYGDIPDGMLVCHSCNNTSCCNPKHLYLGTQSENIKQMYRDCRNANHCGEKSGSAKLIGEDVLKIRLLYSTGEYSQKKIGEMFGVKQMAISRIINKKRWRHI